MKNFFKKTRRFWAILFAIVLVVELAASHVSPRSVFATEDEGMAGVTDDSSVPTTDSSMPETSPADSSTPTVPDSSIPTVPDSSIATVPDSSIPVVPDSSATVEPETESTPPTDTPAPLPTDTPTPMPTNTPTNTPTTAPTTAVPTTAPTNAPIPTTAPLTAAPTNTPVPTNTPTPKPGSESLAKKDEVTPTPKPSADLKFFGQYSSSTQPSAEDSSITNLTTNQTYYLWAVFDVQNSEEVPDCVWTIKKTAGGKGEQKLEGKANQGVAFSLESAGTYSLSLSYTFAGKKQQASTKATVLKATDPFAITANAEPGTYPYGTTVRLTAQGITADEYTLNWSVVDENENTISASTNQTKPYFDFTVNKSNMTYTASAKLVYNKKYELSEVYAATITMKANPLVLAPIYSVPQDPVTRTKGEALSVTLNSAYNNIDYSSYVTYAAYVKAPGSADWNEVTVGKDFTVSLPTSKVGEYTYRFVLSECEDSNADKTLAQAVEGVYTVRETLTIAQDGEISKNSDGRNTIESDLTDVFKLYHADKTTEVAETENVVLNVNKDALAYAQSVPGLGIAINNNNAFSLTGDDAIYYDLSQDVEIKGDILPNTTKEKVDWSETAAAEDLLEAEEQELMISPDTGNSEEALKESWFTGANLVEAKDAEGNVVKVVKDEEEKTVYALMLVEGAENVSFVTYEKDGDDTYAVEKPFLGIYDEENNLAVGKNNKAEDIYVKRNEKTEAETVDRFVYYGPFSVTFKYDDETPTVKNMFSEEVKREEKSAGEGLAGRISRVIREAVEAVEDLAGEELDGKSIVLRRDRSLKVTIELDDGEGSGIPTKLVEENEEYDNVGIAYTFDKDEEREKLSYSSSITIPAEAESRQVFLYEKLADKAGNISYVPLTWTILRDTSAPTLVMADGEGNTMTDLSIDEFHDAGSFSIYAEDKDTGVYRIDAYLLDVSAEGEATQVCNPWSSPAKAEAEDKELLDTSKLQEISADPIEGMKLNTENHAGFALHFLVRVQDWAGNYAYYTYGGKDKESGKAVFTLLENVADDEDGRKAAVTSEKSTAFAIYEETIKGEAEKTDIAFGDDLTLTATRQFTAGETSILTDDKDVTTKGDMREGTTYWCLTKKALSTDADREKAAKDHRLTDANGAILKGTEVQWTVTKQFLESNNKDDYFYLTAFVEYEDTSELAGEDEDEEVETKGKLWAESVKLRVNPLVLSEIVTVSGDNVLPTDKILLDTETSIKLNENFGFVTYSILVESENDPLTQTISPTVGAEANDNVFVFPTDKVGTYTYTIKLESCDDDNANTEKAKEITGKYLVYEELTVTQKEKEHEGYIQKNSDGTKDVIASASNFELSQPKNGETLDLLVNSANLKYVQSAPGKDIKIEIVEGEKAFSINDSARAEYYEILLGNEIVGDIETNMASDIDWDNLDRNSATVNIGDKEHEVVVVPNPGKKADDTLTDEETVDGILNGWFTEDNAEEGHLYVIKARDAGITFITFEDEEKYTGEAEYTGKDISTLVIGNSEQGNLITGLYAKKEVSDNDYIYYGPFSVKFRYDNQHPDLKEIKYTKDETSEFEDSENGKSLSDVFAEVIDYAVNAKIAVDNNSDQIVLRKNRKYTFEAVIEDQAAGSGLAKNIGLLISDKELENPAELDGKDFTATVEVTTGNAVEMVYLYAKALDNAGNNEYRLINQKILTDKVAPEITASSFTFNPNHDGAEFEVTAIDENSGIYKIVSYLYDGQNEPTFYHAWTFGVEQKDGILLHDRKDTEPFSHKTSLDNTCFGSYLRLLIYVEDLAGNSSCYCYDDGETPFVKIEADDVDDAIAKMKEAKYFAIYNNPTVKVSHERKDNLSLITRKKPETQKTPDSENDYIFTDLKRVNVELQNIPIDSLSAVLKKDGTEVENLNLGELTYDVSKHAFVSKAADKNGIIRFTASEDAVYDFEITADVLLAESNDNKNYITFTSDESEKGLDTIKDDAQKRTLTETFIVDKTNPEVSVMLMGTDYMVGNEDEPKTYYVGRENGTDDPHKLEVIFQVDEKNWYQEDYPTISVKKNGVTLEKLPDYISVEDSWQLSNGDVHKITLTIDPTAGKDAKSTDNHLFEDADGEYTFALVNAKNEYYNFVVSKDDDVRLKRKYKSAEESYQTEDYQTKVIIDTVRPEVTYSVGKEGNKYDEAVYYKDSFYEEFSVKEKNFDKSFFTAYSYKSNKLEDDEKKGSVKEPDNGTEQYTYSYKLDRGDEGVYWCVFSGTDLAQNKPYFIEGPNLQEGDQKALESANGKDSEDHVFMTHKKVLDKTTPKVKYTGTWLDRTNIYLENKKNVSYFNKDFALTFSIEEEYFDEKRIDRFYSKIDGELDAGWARKTGQTWGPEDGKAELTGPIGDVKNKKIYKYTAKVKAKPEKGAASNDGRYTFTIRGTDKAGNGLEVLLDVNAGDKVNGDKSIDPEQNDNQKKSGQYTTGVKVMDTTNPRGVYEADELDERYVYTDKNDKADYFNTDICVNFIVTEKNIDQKRIKLTSSNKKATIFDPSSEKKGETTYSALVLADSSLDGRYKFTINGEDKAGNKLIIEKGAGATANDPEKSKNGSYTTGEKVMDKTAPVAEYDVTIKNPDPKKDNYIKLDGSHVYGDADYFNNDMKVTFTVNETNFDLTKGKMTFSYDVKEAAKNAKANLSGPENKGNSTYVYTGTVPALDKGANDGRYTFTIDGEDKAGNKLIVKSSKNVTASDKKQKKAGTYTTVTKVMDTTPPVYTVTDMTKPVSETENVDDIRAYYGKNMLGKNVEVDFLVEDTNLDAKKFAADYARATGEKYNETDPVWTDPFKGTRAKGSREEDEKESYKTSVTVSDRNNGTYRAVISGEDMAGNLLQMSDKEKNRNSSSLKYAKTEGYNGNGQFRTMIKVIDTFAPTGYLNIGDFYKAAIGGNPVLAVELSEPYQKANSASGEITTQDNSPVRIDYPLTSTKQSQPHNTTGSYTFQNKAKINTVGDEQIFYLGITLTDRAGNVTEVEKTNRIYLDTTAASFPIVDERAPTINYAALANSTVHGNRMGEDLYNSSVPIQISVDDPGHGDASQQSNVQSSGLKEVYYTISVDSREVLRKTLYSDTYQRWVNPEGGQYKDPELTYSINPVETADSSLNSNNITLTVYAKDHSGNESFREYKFGIDITKPTIRVTYDNNDAQHDKYFKADRTATIVVTERNFDENKIKVTTESGAQSGWSFANNGGNGDNDTWTKTVTYAEDGNFTFDISGADLLGNVAESITIEGTAAKEFTIDKTAPVVTLSFSKDNGNEGRYYNEDREADIQIDELNFSTEEFDIKGLDGTIARGEAGRASEGGWSDSGIHHTYDVLFNKDGDYQLEVNYTDLAGNKAETVTTELFTIDKTPPVLKFDDSTVRSKTAYGDVFQPRINYEDTNFDPNSVVFTMQGANGGTYKELVNSNSPETFGGFSQYQNIPQEKEYDDIYTLYASVTDKAGNKVDDRLVCSVNRFGSTWTYNDDETKNAIDKFYINAAQDFTLREVNVTPTKVDSVSLQKDGSYNTLVAGEDFEVIDQSEANGWKSYVYRFFAKNFEEEGLYSIVVHTVDEVGNKNANTAERLTDDTKSTPIEFTLDKTSPYAMVTNLDMSVERYNQDELQVELNLEDNLSGVTHFLIEAIKKSGTQTILEVENHIDPETGEYIDEVGLLKEMNKGKVSFTIEKDDDPQTIRVTTWDAAGNMSSSISEDTNEAQDGEVLLKVLVTTNVFSQIYNNKPLFFSMIGGVAAVAGALIFIFVKKRKKKAE